MHDTEVARCLAERLAALAEDADAINLLSDVLKYGTLAIFQAETRTPDHTKLLVSVQLYDSAPRDMHALLDLESGDALTEEAVRTARAAASDGGGPPIRWSARPST